MQAAKGSWEADPVARLAMIFSQRCLLHRKPPNFYVALHRFNPSSKEAPFQKIPNVPQQHFVAAVKILFITYEGLQCSRSCMLKQGLRLGMTVTNRIVFSYERQEF